jgi:hypothetical protein
MKYWEIIADKLRASGWSWGYCTTVYPRWLAQFRVVLLAAANWAFQFQRHPADWAIARMILLDLRVHRTGVDHERIIRETRTFIGKPALWLQIYQTWPRLT